jgi:hypothetical protein
VEKRRVNSGDGSGKEIEKHKNTKESGKRGKEDEKSDDSFTVVDFDESAAKNCDKDKSDNESSGRKKRKIWISDMRSGSDKHSDERKKRKRGSERGKIES